MSKENNTPKKKGGCLKPILIAIGVFLVIGIVGNMGEEKGDKTENKEPIAKQEEQVKKEPKKEKKKPAFDMKSNDTVGATTHILVGDKKEPTGEYEIVCTEGHGVVLVGDKGYPLAADDYKGQELGSETFEEKATASIEMSQEIKARNYNSSDFKVEFYLNKKATE